METNYDDLGRADLIARAEALDAARRADRARLELLEAAWRWFAQTQEAPLLEALAELVVSRLADGCAVHLFDNEGTLRVRALRHRDEARSADLARFVGQPSAFAEEIVEVVLAAGRGVCPGFVRGGAGLSDGPVLLASLESDRRALGLLEVVGAAAVDDEHASLACELAERAAQAIENARTHERAARALDARDELLAYVTHDLGNFLEAILMGSDMLAATSPASERRSSARQVDAIRRAAARMRGLLDLLRDSGTLAAGCFKVDRQPEELDPLLEEALSMLQPRAEAKHVRLRSNAPSVPPVLCDRERIHQVLANVIGNAVEHTPEGSTVAVEATTPDEDTVCVAVSDAGPGIPAEDVPHLFERYWRKGPSAHVGCGLGLFIAHGIVTAHQGRLWVDSEVGRGTTFRFTLPVARRASPRISMTLPAGHAEPERCKSR